MRQLKIGDMRIDRLVEIPALPLDKEFLFANVTDEVIAANRDWLDERSADTLPTVRLRHHEPMQFPDSIAVHREGPHPAHHPAVRICGNPADASWRE